MHNHLAQLNIFSSNRVELLYQQLKMNLFKPGTFPFARRMVIVPNASMKSWLLMRLASDPECQIAAGLEICYLDQALKYFCLDLRREREFHTPSAPELAFLLESTITQIMKDWPKKDEEAKAPWQPLAQYLKIGHQDLTGHRAIQRLVSLSQRLTQLFMQYGRYGCRMLEAWEKSQGPKCWQSELWKHVKKLHPQLCLPYQLLGEGLQALKSPLQPTQLHVFALSFIPAQAHRFLAGAAGLLPVHYYLLSPCKLFWSDLCSDKEKAKLQRYWENKGSSQAQLQALDQFLRDRNALLANFGKMGREMASQIENEACIFEDCYQLPEIVRHIPLYADQMPPDISFDSSSIKPLTLLQAIHADMVLLRNPEDSPKLNLPGDHSIQLHAAPSKHREIEILYNTLIHLLTKHADDESPITPSDVIVLVPDLQAYESTICSLFGSDASLLDYQILESQQLAKNPLVQGFMHLLSLASSRWEADALVQLLEYAAFQDKLNLAPADIQQIRSWIELSGAYWGYNAAHCDDLLSRDHGKESRRVDQNPAGTWEYSLSRLLTTLAIEPEGLDDSSHLFVPPIDEMESSQTDLLAKWLWLINSLQRDLKPIQDGAQMTLKAWGEYLLHLMNTYFAIDDSDLEAVEASKSLNSILQKLSSFVLPADQNFSFQSIHHQLKQLIQEELSTYRESNLQTIRFCSLLPMRAYPAKIVALIGMNEGDFPRKEIPFSLNEMAASAVADYAPSQTDFDRYLFLEALLSARDYFILSHVAYSTEEQREIPPSLLIQELFSYLDAGYTIEDASPSIACLQKHPYDPFDRAYFQNSNLFPSYSLRSYHLCKAASGANKTAPSCFIDEFAISQPLSEIEALTVKELADFASNPLKVYFNKTLKIYLDANAKEIKSAEPFSLSGLEKYQLRMQAIKQPAEHVISTASKSGKLPNGLFKAISADNLSSEIELMHACFSHNGIAASDIVSLTFSDHCEEPIKQQNGNWVVPPIHLQVENVQIKITGSLKEISHGGLIFHQKRDLKGVLKVWPQYLLFCHAIAIYHLPMMGHLISTKDVKAFIFPQSEVEQHLKSFIAYYLIGLHSPSPLIPDWIPHFLKEDPNHLAKSMRASLEGTFSPLFNDYALWLFRDRQNLPSAEGLHVEWHPLASRLFAKAAECL